jgi:hypothetical protein
MNELSEFQLRIFGHASFIRPIELPRITGPTDFRISEPSHQDRNNCPCLYSGINKQKAEFSNSAPLTTQGASEFR